MKEVMANPPLGVTFKATKGDYMTYGIIIVGPEGSPFAGGKFRGTMRFTDLYPFKPPVIKLTTNIFHPNVDFNGNVKLYKVN
jgi:ubiquitin-protein ligase